MSEKSRILSVVVLMLGLALVASTRAGANEITPPPLSSPGIGIVPTLTPTPGESAIVRVMNSIRVSNGVPPLRIGRLLTRAARAHSIDMARRGYFDHGPFVQRLRRFGVRAPYLGENLASGSRPLSAAAIVQMWIASPPHRQNLLDRGFRLVGVGVAGRSTRLVTADFAG
jgi:uncharacterized protein YkwD